MQPPWRNLRGPGRAGRAAGRAAPPAGDRPSPRPGDGASRARPASCRFCLTIAPGEMVAPRSGGSSRSTVLHLVLGRLQSQTRVWYAWAASGLIRDRPAAWRAGWPGYHSVRTVRRDGRGRHRARPPGREPRRPHDRGHTGWVGHLLSTSVGDSGTGISAGDGGGWRSPARFCATRSLSLDEPTAIWLATPGAALVAAVRRARRQPVVLLVARRPALLSLADRWSSPAAGGHGGVRCGAGAGSMEQSIVESRPDDPGPVRPGSTPDRTPVPT
jgi:hypothetical protein